MSVFLLCSFKLVKTTDINTSSCEISREYKIAIENNTPGLNEMSVIRYCIQLTSKCLEFSKKNDIDNGQANCIGYSQLCKSMCEYAFEVNDIPFKVKHVRGYVSEIGLNLCNIFTKIVPNEYKDFVKDHDFIEIECSDLFIYVDPLLYDLINNDCTTIKHKR